MPVAWSSWQVWLRRLPGSPPTKEPRNGEEVLDIFKKEGILVDCWWILVKMHLQNLNIWPETSFYHGISWSMLVSGNASFFWRISKKTRQILRLGNELRFFFAMTIQQLFSSELGCSAGT